MMMVYKYGLLRPTVSDGDAVREQMLRAHRYQNVLTEIERGRRAAVREAMGGVDQIAVAERAAMEARAEEARLVQELRAGRARRRDRRDDPTLLAKLDAARSARRTASSTLADARRAAREGGALATRIAEIDALANELRISARAHCGVYWGTYLLIEESVDRARKMPLYDGTAPNDPRFRRWENEGRIGVQVQGGLPVDRVHDATNRIIRIDPIDPRAWDPSAGRGERRRALGKVRDGTQARLHVRVGSDGRDPVWASFPIVMHRPLPPGATIKRASVALRRVHDREIWTVDLTIDVAAPEPSVANAHAVGVDIGWRKMEDGSVRVGYAVGTDGWTLDARLPADHMRRVEKCRDLASIRAKNFDAAREALAAWMERPEIAEILPAWLVTSTRNLRAWRSIARLSSVVRAWEAARFTGDDGAYAPIHAWWRQEEHLRFWECFQRRSVLNRQIDVFRNIGATLGRRYGTVVFESFDLRTFARQPAAEAPAENETARTNRQAVGVSRFREIVGTAFRTRGGSVVKEPAVDTTRTCHACLAAAAFDAASEVERTCPSCGVRWDQDENAARNLLRSFRESCERSGAAKTSEVAREGENSNEVDTLTVSKAETRWAKVRRMRKEKMAARAIAAPTEE